MAAAQDLGRAFPLASSVVSEGVEESLVSLTPPFSDEGATDRQVWVGINEETYEQKQMQTVHALRSLETGADVCLVAADGQHFLVHSFIVAALSPVLRRYLACDVGRSLFVLQLNGVASTALADILDFIYGCELWLSPPNIAPLLHAAHSLGISILDHPDLRQLQDTVRSGDGGNGSSSSSNSNAEIVLDMPCDAVVSSASPSPPQDAQMSTAGPRRHGRKRKVSREAGQEGSQGVDEAAEHKEPLDTRDQDAAPGTGKTPKLKTCRRSPRVAPKITG